MSSVESGDRCCEDDYDGEIKIGLSARQPTVIETDSNCISGSTLISFDKLLTALGEIELNADPTSSTHRDELMERLDATVASKVVFSDFVKCVKDVYRLKSTERGDLDSSDCDDVRSVAMTEAIRRLAHENDILKKENIALKHHLIILEKSCLKCEDDTTRLRKELQFQIENVRNLSHYSQEAVSKDGHNPRALVDKDVVDSSSHSKTTKDENQVYDQMLSKEHRNIALEMLHFIEKLHLTLSKLEPTCRNSSLCRISSCAAAPIKCVAIPKSVTGVTRAATVSTKTRTDATLAGRGPPRYVRGPRNSQFDQCVQLKKLTEDAKKMVATVKPIFEAEEQEEEEGDDDTSEHVPLTNRPYLNSVDSYQSQNVAKAIGKLHRNIPSTAVVTIMTRV